MHTDVRRLLPSVLLPLVLLIVSDAPAALWIAIPIHVLGFSVLAMLCHGELAQRSSGRAASDRVLSVARRRRRARRRVQHAGRAAGVHVGCGIPAGDRVRLPRLRSEDSSSARRSPTRDRCCSPAFAAGLATVLLVGARLGGLARFPTMAFLGAPALIFWSGAKHNTARFSVGIVGLLAALAIGNAVAPAGGGQTLYADRTFFGVYRVRDRSGAQLRVRCCTGRPSHGRQVLGDDQSRAARPTTIGRVRSARCSRSLGADAQSVGVIGLGTGTLAAYAQPGLAAGRSTRLTAPWSASRATRGYFHYLDRCGEQCSVVLGDARLTLARSRRAHDILVLDAFSSDAIPIHLLTTEALRTYETRLSANGVLAFHISNRHIKLAPVIARLARERGLTALTRLDKGVDSKHGFEASEWVVMARRPERLAAASPRIRAGRSSWPMRVRRGRTIFPISGQNCASNNFRRVPSSNNCGRVCSATEHTPTLPIRSDCPRLPAVAGEDRAPLLWPET